MLTKQDFRDAAYATIDEYPAVAPLYYVGDPMIIQRIDAMAAMLALYSQQLEVAMAEPFAKTRDATVLADAAMRGIIRKATPARVRVLARNAGASAFAIDTSRNLVDTAGNLYRVDAPASVPAGGSATVEAVQLRTITVTHTVSGSGPFYSIEVPYADDGSTLCALSVSDAAGYYTYRNRYVNTAVGERVFHVEVDDLQRTYVRFGLANYVGTQPPDGTVITLTISYSVGDVTPAAASSFSFEYLAHPADTDITLTMDALLTAGAAPLAMSALRDMAKYPSVYDANAVYLGEFDFLVRRQFTSLQFLSVWNEWTEDRARGPNQENINSIFVACMSAVGDEATLTQPDPAVLVPPDRIPDYALTATQTAIKNAILLADDSYRVWFVTPVRSLINMTLTARVPASYQSAVVRGQIIDALVAEFGITSPSARRGKIRPLHQTVYALLKQQIAALSGIGADMALTISDPDEILIRPEMWRYVTDDSLDVTVTTENVSDRSW